MSQPQREELHRALRRHAIHRLNDGSLFCEECGRGWDEGTPELHRDDCLARDEDRSENESETMTQYNPGRSVIAREFRIVQIVAWSALLGVVLLCALLVKTLLIQGRILDHVDRLERIHFAEGAEDRSETKAGP